MCYLDKTSYNHREDTALDRVSVEPLPQQHSQEQEVTKEAKDDQDRIENDDNNEEVLVPENNEFDDL